MSIRSIMADGKVLFPNTVEDNMIQQFTGLISSHMDTAYGIAKLHTVLICLEGAITAVEDTLIIRREVIFAGLGITKDQVKEACV